MLAVMLMAVRPQPMLRNVGGASGTRISMVETGFARVFSERQLAGRGSPGRLALFLQPWMAADGDNKKRAAKHGCRLNTGGGHIRPRRERRGAKALRQKGGRGNEEARGHRGKRDGEGGPGYLRWKRRVGFRGKRPEWVPKMARPVASLTSRRMVRELPGLMKRRGMGTSWR